MVTKEQLFARTTIAPKIAQPLTSKKDVQRIQEIRQERFKQEQIRRMQREAEPVKRENLNKINNKIQTFKQEINNYQERIQTIRNKIQETESREKRDKLRDDLEKYQEDIKAYQKGLSELEKGKSEYQNFQFDLVIANKDYADKIGLYAEQVRSSYQRGYRESLERTKQANKLKELGYDKDSSKWTGQFAEAKNKLEGLNPNQYAQEYAKLSSTVKQAFIAPNNYSNEYLKAQSESRKVQPEIDKIEKNVAYKNIFTGELISVAPEVGRKNPNLRPVYTDLQGREIKTNQLMLQLERPDLFPKAVQGKPVKTEIKSVSTLLKRGAEEISDITDPIYQSFTSRASKAEESRLRESITQDESTLKTGRILIAGTGSFEISESDKQKVKERLEKNKEKLSIIESGITTGKSQITGMVGEFVTPIVAGSVLAPSTGGASLVGAFVYDLLMASPIVLNIASKGFEKLENLSSDVSRKAVNILWDKKVDKSEIQQITNSIKNSKIGQLSAYIISNKIKDLVSDSNSIKKITTSKTLNDLIENSVKGIIESKGVVLQNKKQIISQTTKDVKNFITTKIWQNENYSDIKQQIETARKEKNDIVKRDDILNKQGVLESYDNYINSLLQQKENIIFQRGAIVFTVGALLVGGSSAVYSKYKNIRNMKLQSANYGEVADRVKELNKIGNNPVKIRNSGGNFIADEFIGSINIKKHANDLIDLKFIKNTDNLKSVQIVQGWEAYEQEVWRVVKRVINDKITVYVPSVKNKVFFKNYVVYNIVDKSGQAKSFAIVTRANKPITQFRNVKNAIKYGVGKKVVLSSTIKDSDIINSAVYNLRAGQLSPSESLMSRGFDISDTRKAVTTKKVTKLADSVKLTPEEYWGLSQTKSKTIIDSVKKKPKPTMISADDYWFAGTKQTELGTTRTLSTGITVDTGTLKYVVDQQIELLKRIKSPKTKKIINLISDKVDNAIKSGESSVKLSNKLITQLPLEQKRILESASIGVSTSLTVPKLTPRIKSIDIKVKSDTVNKLSKNYVKVGARIDRIQNNFDSKRFIGTIKKSDVNQINRELNQQKVEVTKQINQNEKAISLTKTTLKELNRELQKTSSAQVSDLVFRERTKLDMLQRNVEGLKLRNRQIQIIQQSTKPTDFRTRDVSTRQLDTTRLRIPSWGFPSDIKKKKKVKGFDDFWGYIPEVRIKGKWTPISLPVSKSKAQKKAVEKTSKELSQSFRLRKTDIRIPKSEIKEFSSLANYYKKKEKGFDVFIEKPKAKIGTESEKKLLKKARKSKKKEKEWSKKVNKYWGFK